VEFQEQGS